MSRLRAAIALASFLAAGFLLSAEAGVKLGTISVGAGFGYASGPFWPGYYPPFFYDPWVYGPWLAPPFYSPVVLIPRPDKGQVSLNSSYKTADVYIDGAYAGTSSSLKKFWLAPGVYELELRPPGQAPQKKRIYVLTWKTLKLNME